MNFRRRTPTSQLGAHTTTAQHCFCAVQLNWHRGDPWKEGGKKTRRKHRTLQSKHVRGADDKPVICPVSWGPGFLSLYKGTSILLMLPVNTLALPEFCSTRVAGSLFWQPTSQNRTPGACRGLSHI